MNAMTMSRHAGIHIADSAKENIILIINHNYTYYNEAIYILSIMLIE
jgi:hypothetical protein